MNEGILVHIRIPEKHADMIDTMVEGKNLTSKVRNYLCSGYIARDYLIREKQKLELALKHIDELLKENPFHNLSALPQKEQDYILATLDTIQRDPDFIHGQKKGYNTEFGKELSLKEFKVLIYEFKEEMAKKKKEAN